jgi:hypothetical protein
LDTSGFMSDFAEHERLRAKQNRIVLLLDLFVYSELLLTARVV